MGFIYQELSPFSWRLGLDKPRYMFFHFFSTINHIYKFQDSVGNILLRIRYELSSQLYLYLDNNLNTQGRLQMRELKQIAAYLFLLYNDHP